MCDLLSPADIQDAVGAPVEPGPVATAVACSWTGAPDAVSAALTIVPSSDPSTCVGQRPTYARPVKDLGLEAWWYLNQADTAVGTMTACLEDANLTLTLTGGSDPATLRQAARKLVSLAIGRR